ncbi:MAG: NAD(P)-binding protein [Bacillota bacterium]
MVYEAAIVATKRGHDVTIYEKNNKLGGQWLSLRQSLQEKSF